MNFQRNKTKRKERMKNRETEPTGRWAQYILWYPEGKTGESIVPLGLQNNTIKRGERIAKGGEILDGRIIDKILSRRKNPEKISKIISRYPRESHYSTYSDSKRIKLCKS